MPAMLAMPTSLPRPAVCMGPTNGVNVATMPKTFVSKTARNADRSSGCDVNVPRDTPALATTTSGAPKRAMKSAARSGELSSPHRAAFVVRRPLPYVYVAREVMRSAGIACQTFDALPLAAEPNAAALDLVLSCVSANFARGPAIALLRSPHFDFGTVRLKPDTTNEVRLKPDTTYVDDVPALDRALAEAGYLGDAESLERLLESWTSGDPVRGRMERALRAGDVLREIVGELSPLRSRAPRLRAAEIPTPSGGGEGKTRQEHLLALPALHAAVGASGLAVRRGHIAAAQSGVCD